LLTKQEIQTEWIKRLRSGTIKQNRNVMHAADGSQCVFGVLAEILFEHGMISREEHFNGYSYNGLVSIIPRELNSYAPAIRLLEMNEKQSFDKIADFIENTIKGD
jgi:hypothetical protein